MTAIERTAYPRFKSQPSTKGLAELYIPTPEEIAFAQTQVNSSSELLSLLVMLKSFQRLGYFPHPDLVPTPVIRHLRSCLKFPSWVSAIPSLRTRRRYQQAIRAYLEVKSYDKVAQQLAATASAVAAEVMDHHPADLLNVAIEELVKERYELPAFSTLDNLVAKVRSISNTRLFQRVSAGLSTVERAYARSTTSTSVFRVSSNSQFTKSTSQKRYSLTSGGTPDQV